MFDVYAYIREETGALLASVSGEPIDPGDVRCCPSGFELSLPHSTGHYRLPTAGLTGIIEALERSDMILSARSEGSHICISLSTKLYALCVERVLSESMMPPMPDDASGDVEYAISRMLMLGRKTGRGCPEDKGVKRVLWLCFGLCEAGISANALSARLDGAARAAAALRPDAPLSQRAHVEKSFGDAAKCAARLLYYGLCAHNAAPLEGDE